VALTEPQLLPEHPAPVTFQVVPVVVLPDTLAWNCCDEPAATMALVGEIVTVTGGIIVTVADADTARSDAEVAVITT
jgi:hypothetical protein